MRTSRQLKQILAPSAGYGAGHSGLAANRGWAKNSQVRGSLQGRIAPVTLRPTSRLHCKEQPGCWDPFILESTSQASKHITSQASDLMADLSDPAGLPCEPHLGLVKLRTAQAASLQSAAAMEGALRPCPETGAAQSPAAGKARLRTCPSARTACTAVKHLLLGDDVGCTPALHQVGWELAMKVCS